MPCSPCMPAHLAGRHEPVQKQHGVVRRLGRELRRSRQGQGRRATETFAERRRRAAAEAGNRRDRVWRWGRSAAARPGQPGPPLLRTLPKAGGNTHTHTKQTIGGTRGRRLSLPCPWTSAPPHPQRRSHAQHARHQLAPAPEVGGAHGRHGHGQAVRLLEVAHHGERVVAAGLCGRVVAEGGPVRAGRRGAGEPGGGGPGWYRPGCACCVTSIVCVCAAHRRLPLSSLRPKRVHIHRRRALQRVRTHAPAGMHTPVVCKTACTTRHTPPVRGR